jgi:hypothetical protein
MPEPDVEAVTRTIEDYFLGWFDGDAERMRRALHPDLAKRSFVEGGGKPAMLRAVTAAQMVTWTADAEGRTDDEAGRRLTITVDEIHGAIASARVDSALYREYVHLVRTPDGWRIANTLWTWTDPSRPGA